MRGPSQLRPFPRRRRYYRATTLQAVSIIENSSFIMRLSLLRVVCALSARLIKPAALQSVRLAHAQLVARPCLTFGAHVKPATHARCMHLDVVLCKRKKEKRGRQWGPKRGCRKKCKRRRRCVKNPKVCLQDLHKHSRRKHNPNCCPCKIPPTMDPYRRQ